jgi:hypothetical protein
MELTKQWDRYARRRDAVLQVGRANGLGPRSYIRFRVTVDHSRSMAPQTRLHLEFGRNRVWVFDLAALPKAWRE